MTITVIYLIVLVSKCSYMMCQNTNAINATRLRTKALSRLITSKYKPQQHKRTGLVRIGRLPPAVINYNYLFDSGAAD